MILTKALACSPVHIAELDDGDIHYEVYKPADRLFLTWEIQSFYWCEPDVRTFDDLARLYPYACHSTDWEPVGIFKIDTADRTPVPTLRYFWEPVGIFKIDTGP